MNCFNYFKNWTQSDYSEFINNKNIIDYHNTLKELDFDVSLQNIVLSIYSDIYLFSEEERNKKIYALIQRLEFEQISELILKHNNIYDYPGDNDYQKLGNYFCHNIDEFLAMLGLYVTKPTDKINELQSVETIYPRYSIRDYQKQCCSEINAVFSENKERVLLHLPTGAGKTRTAINYVCEYLRDNPKKFVVWLADTSELCDQALKAFEQGWESLGDRPMNRFAMYGNISFSLSGIYEGFAVIGLQKFHSLTNKEEIQKLLPDFQEKIGLVIFDEAHKALAPSYNLLVELLLSAHEKQANTRVKLLGLSATPGRSLTNDEENIKLGLLFHNNKVGMKIPGYNSPIEYLQEQGFLAKAIFKNINYDLSKVNFSLFNEQSENTFINETLAKDINRNHAIVQHVQEHFAHNPSSKNIIFSCSLEHSKNLEIWLNGLGYIVKLIDGSTHSVTRKNYIDRYTHGDIQILINYGVLTAGFDAPVTDAVFITRPTQSLVQYLQMAGRAMRGVKSGGHSECVIYTVNDEIEAFSNMFKAFDYWNNNWN
ncbi:MAG TPA: DEAD/DEAH box helicase [Erysipelothrix sp.]